MKRADSVTVRAMDGQLLTRVVVGISKAIILVCKEEEYLTPTKEGREPVSMGFKAQDVVRRRREAPEK